MFTAADGQHYAYDAVGMLNAVGVGAGTQPRVIYVYTADDERLIAYDVSANTSHWTFQGLDNKVLRDVVQSGTAWSSSPATSATPILRTETPRSTTCTPAITGRAGGGFWRWIRTTGTFAKTELTTRSVSSNETFDARKAGTAMHTR